MEMLLIAIIKIKTDKFKIDLIVWKSDVEKHKTFFTKAFKIDLIVWKFVQIHHIPVLIHQFKIDLIVWK